MYFFCILLLNKKKKILSVSPAIIATFSNDTAWFHKELVGTNSSITPLAQH